MHKLRWHKVTTFTEMLTSWWFRCDIILILIWWRYKSFLPITVLPLDRPPSSLWWPITGLRSSEAEAEYQGDLHPCMALVMEPPGFLPRNFPAGWIIKDSWQTMTVKPRCRDGHVWSWSTQTTTYVCINQILDLLVLPPTIQCSMDSEVVNTWQRSIFRVEQGWFIIPYIYAFARCFIQSNLQWIQAMHFTTVSMSVFTVN